MRIGEVAEQAGVSVRSLRYYEEKLLLPAARSTSGQREYTREAVNQVKLIQQLYSAGLSSELVRQVLPVCLNQAQLPDGFTARLIAERERITRQLTDLTEVGSRLDDIITTARGLDAGHVEKSENHS